MKIARFKIGGQSRFGIVEGNLVKEIAGSPLHGIDPTGTTYSLTEVTLQSPVEPSKALATIRNYPSHMVGSLGLSNAIPKEPQAFLKATSCITGPLDTVVLDPESGRVDAEGELVVVIGSRANNVPRDKALEYVLGYTCGNDISAREWQRDDPQWWRAKSSDTFGPIGPWIVTGIHPGNLTLTVRINGKEIQRGSTSELIFDVPSLISHFSRFITLEPGDLIFTGTPGQTSAIGPGDFIEVEIQDIGILQNQVIVKG
jgi:2-keto-4-pentenoate hydratase/2-oxohepta-3-ene-1,7-dioic acid hydratase in catechol pathway